MVDFRMRNAQRLYIRELMDAGVIVFVHELPSFMMHGKAAIFGNKMVAVGNVNWSQHAMTSGGHVYVHKVFGPNQLKTDFQRARLWVGHRASSARLVLPNSKLRVRWSSS